ncbi:hypothetical protein F2P56_031802 [Juglans regia]|uniref:Uncharacterized protein n=1 Tax=Juglans regia TaxID=51240 RepID=A0A833WUG2_JUGRE|nr:hypothetical protein F2P56_031802 [Juglans regia]
MACHAADRVECKEFFIDIPLVREPAEQPGQHCIYKVPKILRKKLRSCLRDFCFGTGRARRILQASLKRTKIKSAIVMLRPQNSAVIKEFVKMIVLDGIFIIELFFRTSGNAEDEDDYILRKPWLREGIQHDLILLENQLPFFVLEDLYTSFLGDSSSCDHHKEREAN